MPSCPLYGLPSTVGASALRSLALPHKPGTEEGSKELGAVGMAWSYITGGLGARPTAARGSAGLAALASPFSFRGSRLPIS